MPRTRQRERRRTPAPVSPSLKGLGERLRQARTEAGLSQAQLGAPHFTRAYVSALELGKVRPAVKSLEFLATKLGRPASYFFEDEEEERRRQERELVMARASQLVAEGNAAEAIRELTAIDLAGLHVADRLAIKRSLGRAYLEAGDGAKAAAILTEALRGYEQLGDTEQVTRTRAQLGAALIWTMDYDEAEAHLSAAIQASATGALRDPVLRVHALYNLGAAFYQRGQYRRALEHFERAASDGADIADQKWLASLYAAMGMSRREVGDFEAAITNLRKSEVLFEAIHNRSRVAEIRFQTARTLREVGNRTRAAALTDEALRSATDAGNEALVARIHAFAALSEAEDGQLREATARLDRAIARADQIRDIRSRFVTRFALAKVLAESDLKRSESLLRETASLVERGGAPELAEVYEELSKVLSRQGRADEALSYAQRAIKAKKDSQRGGA